MTRRESVGVRLVRHGFTDPRTAEQLLAGLDGGAEEAVLAALGEAADPDLALAGAFSARHRGQARPIEAPSCMRSAPTTGCGGGSWVCSA